MNNPITVGPVLAAAISSAVISVVNVVFSQIREGEPELVQSVVRGAVTGIVITAVLYWSSKNRTNAAGQDSQ